MSVTSETEQDPTLDAQNLYGESMDALFPNTDARQGDLNNTSSRSKIIRQENGRYDKISRVSSRKMTRIAERNAKNTDSSIMPHSKGLPNGFSQGTDTMSSRTKRTNIIRTDIKHIRNFKKHS